MVEFAIVLPLLLLILYGITEIGRALYQQNTLYKGVVAGARYMARANEIITVDGEAKTCTPTVLPDAIQNNAKNLIVCGQTANCPSGKSPIVPNLTTTNITISLWPRVDGGGEVFGCIIRVDADVAFGPLFLPHGGSQGAFTIHAETEERYIGL